MLSACGSGERVSLPDALAALNRDLVESNIVYPDNVDTPDGRDRFNSAIRKIQAQFCEPDPSVMMMLKDFDLKLEGSFGTDTTAKAGATGPVPSGELSFGVTTSRTQTLELPVTVTSLANVPNVYQAYLVENLKDSPSPVVDKARVISTVASLRDVVGNALKNPSVDAFAKPCTDRAKQLADRGRPVPVYLRTKLPDGAKPGL